LYILGEYKASFKVNNVSKCKVEFEVEEINQQNTEITYTVENAKGSIEAMTETIITVALQAKKICRN